MTLTSTNELAEEFIARWRRNIGQIYQEPSEVDEILAKDMVKMPSAWLEDVEWGAIRRFALINGDLNALWFDEDYATGSRWAGITAPPLYILAISLGMNWGSQAALESLGNPNICDVSLNGGTEIEFFEAVRPGDTINCKDKLLDIYEKQGKRAKMIFVIDECTYSNQKGQIVAVSRSTAILARNTKLTGDHS